MNLEITLKELVKEFAINPIEVNEINNSTTLVDDLGYDSLQMIDFILSLEEKFSINFDDEDFDLELLNNYYNLECIIKEKLS